MQLSLTNLRWWYVAERLRSLRGYGSCWG